MERRCKECLEDWKHCDCNGGSTTAYLQAEYECPFCNTEYVEEWIGAKEVTCESCGKTFEVD